MLVALQLVVRAEAVRAGVPLGVRLLLLLLLLHSILLLLLLLLGNAERRLRQGSLLTELCLLLPAGILELVVHCASAYGQPHEQCKTIGSATAHLPEGTGEGCPDGWSTDVCDLFDLSHEGLGTMFWRWQLGSYAAKLHDGETAGRGTLMASTKNNRRSADTAAVGSNAKGAPIRKSETLLLCGRMHCSSKRSSFLSPAAAPAKIPANRAMRPVTR